MSAIAAQANHILDHDHDRDEASANGIDIRHKPGAMNHLIRVRSAGGWASYRIDRWD